MPLSGADAAAGLHGGVNAPMADIAALNGFQVQQ